MRVAVVVGTRPEAIKMAPVIRRLKAHGQFDTLVVSTGQHRELLDQALAVFEITPDHDLAVMRSDQSLSGLTAAVIERFDALIAEMRPDRVIVHGDTTTAMAASLAAFYRKIPVGHVEAGLRTGDLERPWPEELNRRVIDEAADLLWAPTASARDALAGEGLASGKRILVTGNTVVDAVLWASARLDQDAALNAALRERFSFLRDDRRLILVTGHRRESFGHGFEEICRAIRDLAGDGSVEILYAVHLNPNVRRPVNALLRGFGNIRLVEPLDYLAFVYLMKRSRLILTDSGGVQEEAPSLAKPVVVMRDVTERPEGVASGLVRLTGAHRGEIVSAVTRVLEAPPGVSDTGGNPYGDGKASERIVDSLLEESAREAGSP